MELFSEIFVGTLLTHWALGDMIRLNECDFRTLVRDYIHKNFCKIALKWMQQDLTED